MARRVRAVEASRQVAPRKNTDSWRSDRVEVMGVVSYADSGGGREEELAGDVGDLVMTRAMGSFWTASICAFAARQVPVAAESGRCRISFPCSGPAAASGGSGVRLRALH